MQYNDPTNKQGLLQDCEFLCNLPDGTIFGSATLKAVFTRLLNLRYSRTMAKLQILSGKDGAEDTNYADQQFSLFDIEFGVNNYQFLADEDGNTITDITGVLIQSSSSSDYYPLKRLLLSDDNAPLIMSPNVSNTGTPTKFLEKNNTVFFDKLPDYAKTDGGKLFYRLVPSYFTTADTTKAPGFVEGFHRILSIGSSIDWLAINKPDNTVQIASLRSDLSEMTADLTTYIQQKNPAADRMTGARHSSR